MSRLFAIRCSKALRLSSFFLWCGLVPGCGLKNQPPPVAPVTAIPHPTGIDWVKGSIDQALGNAAKSGQPLLVYWGASWCPYCQVLRKSVFTRPDFIAKTTAFVALSMDADSPDVQRLGVKYKVAGYPTLLVLRADGSELARMSGGMDLSMYASLLDQALRDDRPIEDVLARVVTVDDCRRVAYQTWDLSQSAYAGIAAMLESAALRCTAGERTRLEIAALDLALRSGAPLPPLAPRVRRLYERLEQPDITAAVDLLVGMDDRLAVLVVSQGAEFANRFGRRWVSRMQAAAENPGLSDADRLIALASALRAMRSLSPDQTIPVEKQALARARVDASLQADRDPFRRDDLVNAAGLVYSALADVAAARAMYLRELPNTRTPYYYQSHLGLLAEQSGNLSEALDWYAKAYETAKGMATRVRWGSTYLRALLRLAPEDGARIRAVALRVAAEASVAAKSGSAPRAALVNMRESLEQWASSSSKRKIAGEVFAQLPDIALSKGG